VVHAEQLGDLDRGADLFAALAQRGGGRIFVLVDKAAGETPEPVARLDRAPAQHDPAVRFDHYRRRDLGVAPEHEAVGGAGLELAAFDQRGDERGAAVDAEVTHLLPSLAANAGARGLQRAP